MCVCVPYALLNRSSDRRETLQSCRIHPGDGLCQTFNFKTMTAMVISAETAITGINFYDVTNQGRQFHSFYY